jgi:hypothetical protein
MTRQLYRYSDLEYQKCQYEEGSSEFDALIENRNRGAYSEEAVVSDSDHTCSKQCKSSDDSFRERVKTQVQKKRAATERRLYNKRDFKLVPNDYRVDWNTT